MNADKKWMNKKHVYTVYHIKCNLNYDLINTLHYQLNLIFFFVRFYSV